ncbi:hypothetical protein MUK42_34550 [Musa troglodytarum]|uniref:Uncharacterized protein n=1 Tax=Musa troglodytarum TaxID=320322 RepID=A0A9E7EA09_9LILI|nr:hypothetical protein MUK42_34550 [Musa troglodytarum]
MVESLRRSHLSKEEKGEKEVRFYCGTTFPPLLYGFQLVEGRLSSAPDVLLHFDPRVGRCGDHQVIPFAVPALKSS